LRSAIARAARYSTGWNWIGALRPEEVIDFHEWQNETAYQARLSELGRAIDGG